MSNFAAFVALWLFSSAVTAQIDSADCTLTSLYDWAYNSQNQSPCEVAGYLQSTCSGGVFTVDPLLSGESYYGPTALGGDDICKCNTVVYSLMSACGACQSAFWIDWPEWATNCSRTSSPGTFPNPVPQGTHVPQWALADVTRQALSLWHSSEAFDIGDTPEIGPGELIDSSKRSNTTSSTGSGAKSTSSRSSSNPTNFPAVTTPAPLASSTTSRSSQSSSSSSPTSSSSQGSKSNMGAIVGGAVGGVAVIAMAAIGVFFLRRPRPQAPSAAYRVDPAPQPRYESQNPFSDDGTHVSSPMTASETSTVPMRLYDPNDSTTFPGYQGVPGAPDIPAQSPFLPYNGTGNTMANMQTSHPGYNGLPTV